MSVTADPRRRQRLWLAWALLVAIETLGQVAMKIAGTHAGFEVLDAATLRAALATPWLWLAVACYLGQFALWMGILEHSELSVAFPITAVVLVAVLLVSWLWFGEALGGSKLAGAAVIIAGILLLGSERAPAGHAVVQATTKGNPT